MARFTKYKVYPNYNRSVIAFKNTIDSYMIRNNYVSYGNVQVNFSRLEITIGGYTERFLPIEPLDKFQGTRPDLIEIVDEHEIERKVLESFHKEVFFLWRKL